MNQETTKFTPFELTYGRKAKQLADQLMGTDSTKTGTWEQQVEHRAKEEIQELHRIRNKAKEFIAVAQERQKKNYDKLHKEIERLKIGDLVLLYRRLSITISKYCGVILVSKARFKVERTVLHCQYKRNDISAQKE